MTLRDRVAQPRALRGGHARRGAGRQRRSVSPLHARRRPGDRPPRRRYRGQGRHDRRLPASRHREDGREPHLPADRAAHRPARLRGLDVRELGVLPRGRASRRHPRARACRVSARDRLRAPAHREPHDGHRRLGRRYRRVHHVHLRLRRQGTHRRALRGAVRCPAHLQLRPPGRRLVRCARGLDRRGAASSPRESARTWTRWTRSSSATSSPAAGSRVSACCPPRTRWRGAPPGPPRGRAASTGTCASTTRTPSTRAWTST